MAAFADICNDPGVKVATSIASGSASTTGSSKPSGTGSPIAYVTGSGSSYGNSTQPTATSGPRASGSGSSGMSDTLSGGLVQSTGAARRVEIGIAAVMAGLMAVTL
ncbi:hypothetical protein ACN47E_010071 [Coniothyrium glycines]